jgi:uncharacterized membrane protein SpoIIM required for sporulation
MNKENILKILTVLILVFLVSFGIIFLSVKQDRKLNSMYVIQVGTSYYHTKEIKNLPNNQIEFIDNRTERKLIVSGNYTIFNPKYK